MRFPEGLLTCRPGTSQEGSPSSCTVPGTGSQCRSRIWPLRTWYSSAIPRSLLSGSSAPSSAEPFCPSWELLLESMLLLWDESLESSSPRSMVTGMDAARRRLELCAVEKAERECSKKAGRGAGGSRDLPHITLSPSARDRRARQQGHHYSREHGEGSGTGVSEGKLLCFHLQDTKKAALHLLFSLSLPLFHPRAFKAPSS